MAELVAMLKAAASRVGYPYVWGGSGPTTFDCSGLVQWSFAQAGVVMPRVAADQARTGPAIPFSQAQAGDLLFYRTDPTAPDYISHVAIYLGKGLMIQAPEPGENVQIVPVALGSEFAGVVRVSPAIAAQVAAAPGGLTRLAGHAWSWTRSVLGRARPTTPGSRPRPADHAGACPRPGLHDYIIT